MKTCGEAIDCGQQSVLGVELKEPSKIHEREQQVTHFIADVALVPLGARGSKFREFLLDLCPNRFDVRPVESGLSGPLADFLRSRKSGHEFRERSEYRREGLIFFLLGFEPR